jgi:hypothetical protein
MVANTTLSNIMRCSFKNNAFLLPAGVPKAEAQ